MRRNDREITDLDRIQAIMEACSVCSVAFSGEEYPYVIPLNFGVCRDKDTFRLYFHGAPSGTKFERMDRDCRVAFCMAEEGELKLMAPACGSTMLYASVCGTGRLRRVEDPEEKMRGLTCLMHQYDREHGEFEFGPEVTARTTVLCLEVETCTGKSNRPAR